MDWVLSPFIVLNSGKYRALVIDYAAHRYQIIPLSAAAVLQRFNAPLQTAAVLNCYPADQRAMLQSYLTFFQEKRWLLDAKSVENFKAPDFETNQPLKRVKNLYVSGIALASGLLPDFSQIRKDCGAHCLMLIADHAVVTQMQTLLSSNVFRQVAVVVLAIEQLAVARELAQHFAARIPFYIHESVLNDLPASGAGFLFEVFKEHRVVKADDFATELNVLLNNYHYSPGVFSLYIDQNLAVFPHPLDQAWCLGYLTSAVSIRKMITSDIAIAYQQTARRQITQCADCEFNLCCVLPIRKRHDIRDLLSAPKDCHYDVVNGEFHLQAEQTAVIM